MRTTWKHIRIINLPRNTNVDVSRKQYFRMKSFLLCLAVDLRRPIFPRRDSCRGNQCTWQSRIYHPASLIDRKGLRGGIHISAVPLLSRLLHAASPHRRRDNPRAFARLRSYVPSNVARFHSTRTNSPVRRFLSLSKYEFHLTWRNFYLYKWNFLLERVKLFICTSESFHLYKLNSLLVLVKLFICMSETFYLYKLNSLFLWNLLLARVKLFTCTT